MTKKPSEKNKAWEKDRRDRLNKTFDELAKLLPKFDPSVVWSKIEIIQKAIAFISDLQKRLEDYLTAKDPELLKEYKEFVNCLRFYQERNAQLTELLKKAKVTLPSPPVPQALPQLLLDKPELLPKEDHAENIGLQKPKKPRNRSKKGCDNSAAKKHEEVKEKKETPSEGDVEKAEKKPIKLEALAKPTAIITAFGRDAPSEAPKAPTPQLPPPVPAKPLLLRIRKLRKHQQQLKLIARPMFRKCYPHPSRMLKWNFDAVSNRKLLVKQRRREAVKIKKQRRIEQPLKRLKVEFHPEPMREQSVSPTAAFLLSFPVVTSSMLGGKNVENADSSVNLENLNNFFTTEEYSKFCDQNTVVGEKILSPLPVENEGKPLVSEKPMTVFTVSEITRPTSPKKALLGNGNRLNGISLTTPTFDSCFNFSSGNPMIGSTSMCGKNTNGQQVTPNQYPSSNIVPDILFPSTSPAKLTIKQEQINPNSVLSKTANSTEKFFPRYNHSTSSSLRTALESPSKVLNPSPPISQKGSVRANLPKTTNWPVKSATPRGKSITNQNVSSNNNCKSALLRTNSKTTPSASTKSAVVPFLSPTKNFFYDFPTQNRGSISSASSADPLISSTTAVKPHNSVKTEFPYLPPNGSRTTSTTCNQNTLFTPFDLATIVCDSLTSTSFTFSSATSKSSDLNVVEAGNKTSSNNRCNQGNLFLPYEEAQYTPTFPPSQTKSTDSQMGRETSWKPLEKQKESTPDQIFYDCEQSKPQQKNHVNWMTSPTIDYTPTPTASALPLPTIDFGNQFAGTSANFDFSFGCRKDSYDDDNQFINWSPTKPLNADFSTAYSFENFGSNEPPPNKTVKQIFSVSQLVDQTPPQDVGSSIKKTVPKATTQKSTPVKQPFSNIYSAESLIAKKDNNRFCSPVENASNNHSEYHNSSSYFFNYPNTQSCPENDYLGASTYSASQQTVKNTSIHTPSGGGSLTMPPTFDSAASAAPTANYFSHTISSNNNDPYDPTYFPSSNYNQNWNHGTPAGKAATSVNIFNQNQFGTLQDPSSCQQNSNVSGNLTNFNLSSICPEIDGKEGPNGW